MKMLLSHNIILPKYLRIVKEKGSRISKTRAREGGASVFTALFSSFRISAPPSARSKNFRAKPKRAGKKEGGLGEEIFARLLCPAKRAGGGKRFRRLALSQTSKQNNFQFLLKEKRARAKYKKLKENCFALLAEIRRAETLGRI